MPAPESVQVTAVFEVPATLAENCCCPLVATVAEVGETETTMDVADSITTVAEADFVGAATEVAVTVAFAGLGTTAGAV